MSFWSRFQTQPLEKFLGRSVDAVKTLGECDDDTELRSVAVNATGFQRAPEPAPQLLFGYREADRLVWSCRASRLGVARGCSLGGAKSPGDLATLTKHLGAADRSHQVTSALRDHWFDRGPLLYVARAQTLEDGALSDVLVAERSLAPPGFDGDWRHARRTTIIRFPGSHEAFITALRATFELTDFVEHGRTWTAWCCALRMSGDAFHGTEAIRVSASAPSDVTVDAFADTVRAAVTQLGTEV